MKLGEAMYKATQEEEEAASSGDGEEAPEGKTEEGEVVDADFEEVDEHDQGPGSKTGPGPG